MARTKVTTFRRGKVYDRDGHACVRCGWKPADTGPFRVSPLTHRRVLCMLEIDHIVPVSLGGTNDIDNLQTLCSCCNASKGARV